MYRSQVKGNLAEVTSMALLSGAVGNYYPIMARGSDNAFRYCEYLGLQSMVDTLSPSV
jgi:hypothetical protein